MYEQHLIQSGLTKEQAIVYEVLLKSGALPAGKISSKTAELNEKIPIKRGLVYKILEQLVDFGLIEKKEEPGKVAIFQVVHPLKIKELVEKKERQAKDAEIALDGVLSSLVSDFNLISGKPGIQYFEGKEGLLKLTFDNLNSKSDIYAYIDNEAVKKYFPELNEQYKKERKLRGIKQKIITIDCEYVRKMADKYDRSITDIHLIDGKTYPFATAMKIYDNKVSYITLTENKKIGFLIEDADIARMHKVLFEYMWANTKSLFEDNTYKASL
jgi:sugar-specific transcriptional regulator TrmB